MTPELAGLIALFGTQIALGVALFGAIKWSADRSERRSERIESEISNLRTVDLAEIRTEQNRRFERVEAEISNLRTVDLAEIRTEQNRRFERVEADLSGLRTEQNRRFERVETVLSELKAGQARLEGMFEGAFERIPRVRREYQDDDGGGVAAESPASYDPRQP